MHEHSIERTERVVRDGRLSPSSLGPTFTACALHRPLVATSSLDHASQFSTTEGEEWDHLIAEYRH